MRIAIISPPWIAVPPAGYGGIERVVANVAEGMVKKGHEVTLFATGDSQTGARLDFFYQKALGNNLNLKFNPYHMLNHLYAFFQKTEGRFDIIHNHSGRLALFLSHFVKTPFVYTLHGSYMKTDSASAYGIAESGRELLGRFTSIPYVSISDKQREGLPQLNYLKTIYNGVILSEFAVNENGGNHLVWFGRVARTKGLDAAMKISQMTGKHLHAVYFLDPGERDYFEKTIKPLCDPEFCTLMTEIKDVQSKSDFLGRAKALLFPITWDEPFGIVMIEAMACGTPVIAFAKGSVPEVIKDGETGFLVNYSDKDRAGNFIIQETGVEGLQAAVQKIYSLPEKNYRDMRRACRKRVEQYFTVEKMVAEYEQVYRQLA